MLDWIIDYYPLIVEIGRVFFGAFFLAMVIEAIRIIIQEEL